MSISLSVIMIVRNDKLRFSRALSSVLAQKIKELEIIVIDGGSTDGTLDEIAAHQDQLHYWESGLDKGIADAFNRGIVQATGEFIAILNSDDYWEPNTLQQLLGARQAHPDGDIFYGAVRYVDQAKGYTYVRSPCLASMKYRMWLFHPAMFVRRSSYQRVGLYDPAYTHAMDSEWCHRAIAAGENFCEIPAVLANMSLGGVSDREYTISLQQYRHSLIRNKICSKAEAFAYYFFFSTLKHLMQQRWMQPLKRLRDRLL